MKKTDDGFIFSSDRKIYAHRCIVGINPELELSEGYDGGITWPIPEWWKDEKGWVDEETLTVEDMKELADYMISLWTEFRKTLE